MEFSVKNVLSESVGILLANIGKCALAVLLLIIGLGVSGFLTFSLFSIDTVALQEFMTVAQSGGDTRDLGDNVLSSLVNVFFASIVFLLFVALFTSMLFNYAVRLGGLGPVGAYPGFGTLLSTGVINGLKFIFITILLGIVVGIVAVVLSMFGLVQDPPQPVAGAGDSPMMAALTAAMVQSASLSEIFVTSILTLVICFVYAVFSANLTKTALQDEVSSYETPHTASFAMALFVIYVATQVPTYLFAALGMILPALIASTVFSFISMLLIGISHGVRHRMCAPDGQMAYEAPSAPVAPADAEPVSVEETVDTDEDPKV